MQGRISDYLQYIRNVQCNMNIIIILARLPAAPAGAREKIAEAKVMRAKARALSKEKAESYLVNPFP